ncbi:DUF6119 family protein [Peribacillus butanolivorans]|uniref:DUF6119 family protein n=1 Tax=Peribacillus butanolivorans TaxID=421767 RepID=UPI0036977254
MKLSYYLFNENVREFENLILPNKVNVDNNFIELQPSNQDLDFEFKVYIQRNRTKEPKWIAFLEDDLEIPNREQIRNSVNSFVILVKIYKNDLPYFFAITGGFGFTAINRNNLENGFGLKVALNTIDSRELKSFDVRNIDLKTKQKRVLINKGSELGEFDLDFEQDLINLVSGKTANETIGTSIKGSTSSLSLNSDVTFSNLGDKCSQLLDLFLSEDYKEDFGFIDNVNIVRDPDIISKLTQDLFETLRNRETDHLSLTYPDMIEYEKCSSYQIKKGYKLVETEEIVLNDLYTLLDTIEFESPDIIKKIKVIGFDEAGTPTTSSVTLNHFIVYQTTIEGDTYIFSLNNWYKIDNDYYNRVHTEIMGVSLLKNENFLTGIQVGESEGSYNERQNSEYFICLDKKNFQIPHSRSKIEICDLLSRDHHFVCVKKETRSATLSHLFAQGSVSMKLLRELLEYKQAIITNLKEKFPEYDFNEDNFPYSECTLVYAISTSKSEDIREVLPFFSKVNLLNHINLIKRLGIKVSLYKIPVLTN